MDRILAHFILFCLCGVFLGRCSSVDRGIVFGLLGGLLFIGMGLAIVRRRNQHGFELRWFCFGLLACAWGFGHSFPFPNHDLRNARIVRSHFAGEFSEVLVVENHQRYFSVQGRGAIGDLGSVQVQPSTSPWQSVDSRWRPHHHRSTDAPLLQDDNSWYAYQPLKSQILQRIYLYMPTLGPWLEGILLGSIADLPVDLRNDFKIAGVFHVLAVSGQHMTFLGSLILLGILFPLQIFYSLLCIPGRWWPWIYGAGRIVAVTIVLLYAGCVGLPASALRAAFIFVLSQLALTLWGRPSHLRILMMVAVLHLLLYPEGFLLLGNLLSWISYLLVIAFTPQSDASVGRRIRAAILLQFYLAIVIGFAIGSFSFLGVVANIVLVPMFSGAFLLAIITLLWPVPWLLTIASHSQWNYIGLVEWCGSLGRRWPWLFMDINRDLDANAPHVRVGLGVVLCFILIQAWRILRAKDAQPLKPIRRLSRHQQLPPSDQRLGQEPSIHQELRQ